jgi:hypothetical protein
MRTHSRVGWLNAKAMPRLLCRQGTDALPLPGIFAMTRPLSASTQTGAAIRAIDSSLMLKVFYVFAALALASLAISAAGKWIGRSIAMAGHTDDRSPREIVIGDNVISAPANAIRFERARRDGVAERLDLYFRWPELEGYSELTRDDFNHANGGRRIIFVSLEPQAMSRDMSGRFDPIYSKIIVRPDVAGPAGAFMYQFTKHSGYDDEVLVVGERPGEAPFVARCLSGASAADSLAPCQRDILFADGLSLSYRFPEDLLTHWREMDAAILAKASSMLRTGS